MHRVENLVRPRRDTATHPLAPLRQADPDPRATNPHGRPGADDPRSSAPSSHGTDSSSRSLPFCTPPDMPRPPSPFRGQTPDPLRSSPSTLQGLPSRPTRADGSLPLTTGEPSWE